MRYKKGDIVRVREWADMQKEFGVDEDGHIKLGKWVFNKAAKPLCGEEIMIKCISKSLDGDLYYSIEGSSWSFTDDMLESAETAKESTKLDEEYPDRGSHYTRLDPSTVQRFHDAHTSDEFIGAMLFNITKYAERFGHKDDPLKEALKIRDYADMLVRHLEGKKIQ